MLIIYTFLAITLILLMFNKSLLMSMFLMLIYLYSIFTMIAFTYYRDKIILYDNITIFEKGIFIKYYAFILISFCLMAFFYILLSKIRVDIRLNVVKLNHIKYLNYIFIICILLYVFIMIYFLLKNYDNLSYYNQEILKNNKLWNYLHSVYFIIITILIGKILSIETKLLNKTGCIILVTTICFLTLLLSYRVGQRSLLFSTMLGLIGFYVTYNSSYNKLNTEYKLSSLFNVKTITFFLGMVIYFQAARYTRGADGNSLLNLIIDFDSNWMLSIFNPEALVFQDWFSPSYSLMYAIENNWIIPFEVIKSNTLNLFSFVIGSYPTLGNLLIAEIAGNVPRHVGMGYYYLAEGFNFLGYFGSIIIAFWAAFFIILYERIFMRTNSILFNSIMAGIMCYYMLGIVRGQSLFFVKGIIMYVLPCILLYCLAFKEKIILLVIKHKIS